jgi:hypothetical protein
MAKHCQHKPKDSPDTKKKLQVAGTSRDDAILILRGLNFHDILYVPMFKFRLGISAFRKKNKMPYVTHFSANKFQYTLLP